MQGVAKNRFDIRNRVMYEKNSESIGCAIRHLCVCVCVHRHSGSSHFLAEVGGGTGMMGASFELFAIACNGACMRQMAAASGQQYQGLQAAAGANMETPRPRMGAPPRAS